MENATIEKYIETFDWLNPKTRLRTKLGEHIGGGRFANFTHNNLEDELALLNNPTSGKMIGAGADGDVYLHNLGNKARAVKVYREQAGVYFGRRVGTCISQFRCLRKIRQLGFEAPEVYAASEKVLVMNYIQYENLKEHLNKLNSPDSIYLHRKWIEVLGEISQLVGNERMDRAVVNGYIRPMKNFYHLGAIDQG